MCDLARRNFAENFQHGLLDLLGVHLRVLFLMVLDDLLQYGRFRVDQYGGPVWIIRSPKGDMPRPLELVLGDETIARYVDRHAALDAFVRPSYEDRGPKDLDGLLVLAPNTAFAIGIIDHRENLDFIVTLDRGRRLRIPFLLTRLDEYLHRPTVAEFFL